MFDLGSLVRNRVLALLLFALLLVPVDSLEAGMAKPDRNQEQLIGPVKTLLIEFAKLNNVDGEWVPESPRTPWLSTLYDSSGFQIEEEQFYTEKSLDFKSVFQYDAAGNLSEGVEYDYQGTVAFKWSYAYDLVKKTIEKKQFFPDGVLFSVTTRFYDANGNLVEEKRFLAQTQNRFKWTYAYDNAGKKIEEAYFLERRGERPGSTKSLLNFKAIFRYDKEGNMIEETKYDASGRISGVRRFKYAFDQVGNWITQTAFESLGDNETSALVPTEITYRTFSYYPQ